MAQRWTGLQKLAVVPTFNRQFDTLPPPSDWDNLIMRRVLYDPDPTTGVDRSLRSYLAAISYGRAVLDAKLFPRAYSDGLGVIEAAYQSLPPGHGYPYVLCVIPWYDGNVHRKGFFRTVGENGVTAVARVAMYDGVLAQKQRQTTGVWAMEVLHAIPGLPDLYRTATNPFPNPSIGNFDNMDQVGGMHTCAYLKLAAGWLGASHFATHTGSQKLYKLHAIGISPPPPGRVAAVRIPARTSNHTFIAEARLNADVYEQGFAPLTTGPLEFRGIPAEGVIVYEVTTPDHLEQVRLVGGPLAIGQTYSNPAEGFTITATSPVEGGITIRVTRTADPSCAALLQQIAVAEQAIEAVDDPFTKSRLRAKKRKLEEEAQKLGCL